MKVFIFVRGVNTSFKRTIVEQLRSGLNPDINTVRAIRVSMSDTGQPNKKAADKDCKNLVRKILAGSHEEQFIVVDNESIQPVHWQSYYNISNAVCVDALAVGLDVFSPENIFTDSEKRKNNEQIAKSDMFIASMAKYIRIEKDEDVLEAIDQLTKLHKE